MVVRVGLLLICEPDGAEDGETVLADLRTLLAESARDFIPVATRAYVAPPRYHVEESLRRWCDEEELDLILTVGGTFPAPGPSSQEIVPEATTAVVERALPSLPHAMRARAAETYRLALLDRGVAGIRGRTLLVNLPGDRQLASTFLAAILDLIPAILARLGAEMESAYLAPAALPQKEKPETDSGTLNRDEFAAFLQRRQHSG